ncbi:DUF2752 domain-containing protein [Thermosulfurimonas sp. F29]|uniref:DUF2752 domain-containing protein n=1 Tax=Thermosulfurimonas sp. F29 TaxID=2867247 RepID=UPI001C82C285|nr:DUF2752 domain-containing protein [Thermosulfurimonas sp. F29]MBX6423747.1 DUF2752 domain-containing protein [Thermosulfurimonas sp. F29]
MSERGFSILLILVFVIMILAHFITPLSTFYRKGEKVVFCPFRRMTGLPCPGCGMTRALWALSGGRVREALVLNPFSVIILGLALLEVIPGFRIENPERIYRWLLPLVLLWWGVRLL